MLNAAAGLDRAWDSDLGRRNRGNHSGSDSRRYLDRAARAAVSIAFFIGGKVIGIWGVHIPTVTARLGVDPGILGLALLCVGIGAASAPVLVAWLVERMCSRVASTIMLAYFVIVLPIVIASPSTPALFVAAFLLGFGGGGLNVAINTQAAETERARGRPIMSSFHGFWSLGTLAGAATGAEILRLGFGDGRGAAAVALVMLAVGMIASRGFLVTRARSPAPGVPRARRFALPTAALVGVVAIGFFSEFIEGSVNNWSALYLSTVRQLSNAEAANGLVMFSLVMTICRLAGGPVVSRLGERTLIAAGGLLAAIGVAVVLLAPGSQLSPIGFGIVALGISNIVPVVIGAASRTPGVAPGTAVAAVFSAITLGYLTAPPAIGIVAQYFGLATGVALLGLAGVVIVLIAVLRQGRQAAPAG